MANVDSRITYLIVAKVSQHLEPDVGLVVVWRDGSEKGHVNVFVGEGRIPGGDPDDGYLIETAGVADRGRRQIARLLVRHNDRVNLKEQAQNAMKLLLRMMMDSPLTDFTPHPR